MTKHRHDSGGGTGDAESKKVDSPSAPAEVKSATGATFPGASASGPSPSEIAEKVDPASGVVYPESNQPVDPTNLPNLGATGAKIAGERKRFRVTFNPPSPVGDRAKLFDCEALDGSDALAQWRAYTGFLGDLAVQPIIAEVTE